MCRTVCRGFLQGAEASRKVCVNQYAMHVCFPKKEGLECSDSYGDVSVECKNSCKDKKKWWKKGKCAKKAARGKCTKKKIKKHCKATCNMC